MPHEIFEICTSGNKEKLTQLFDENEKTLLLALKAEDGKTATELAACYGHLELIQELLKNGFKLDFVSPRNYTLLHWAASWGHVEVAKYLINSGIQISIKNVHGETAKQLAERYCNDDCTIFLHKSELLEELKSLALSYKDVIADPEKNQGKFSKEDKVHGNRYCDEKIDWIEQNKNLTSIQQVQDKTIELQQQLKNTMNKLNE